MTTNATREHCIDAETLAAWADAGLSAADAAKVELHVSNCERCQEVLAAFVRSEPVAAAVIPFWTRRPVRWGAAGLAAAAALVMMVWTEPPSSFPKQESTVASNEMDAVAPADDTSRFRAESPPEAKALEQAAPETAERSAKLDAPGVSSAIAPSAEAAPTAPPPATSPPPPPPVEPQVVGGVGRVVGGRAAEAEPTRELRETVMSDKKAADELAPIEIIAPAGTFAARRQDLAQAGAARGALAASRGGGSAVPARWRILEGTRVERSIDNGVTWTPASITTASPFLLTGGAAASQTVCWLVGQGGAVFVATDGVTFEQVTSPDPAAITSVEAADALHATVTTVDGRKFSTSDAGVTWTTS